MQDPNLLLPGKLERLGGGRAGRLRTKDGEGCCPVSMTTTGMYRLDHGTSCMCVYPSYVSIKIYIYEMGSNKWVCTVFTATACIPIKALNHF